MYHRNRNRGLFRLGAPPPCPSKHGSTSDVELSFAHALHSLLCASSAPGSGLGGMMPTAWSSESVRYLYSVAAVSAVRRLEWALTALETSKYRLPVP
jgi:hypothetical protein